MEELAKDEKKSFSLDPQELSTIHPSEIAKILDEVYYEDEELFHSTIESLPKDVLGNVLLELPERYRYEALENLESEALVEAVDGLESDDATDLIQEIESFDEQKAQEVLENLEKQDIDEIIRLKQYEDNQAGALMQTEIFDVYEDEIIMDAINRYRRLKEANELDNIHQAFVVDGHHRLIHSVWLEDLIMYDFNRTFQDVLEKEYKDESTNVIIHAEDDVDTVIKMFEQYDMPDMPVVDKNGVLLGRITSDDIYDSIENRATEQIYHMAGVNEEAESEEDMMEIGKKRAIWLFVNLLTAILASVVIGVFEDTIEKFVALAVLMPIVASMGGNAGTQSLTVVVRQLALGNIEQTDAIDTIKKEVLVSFFNGLLFAIIMGVVSYLWFNSYMLGVVIGIALIVNLLFAGFFGAAIPLALKKLKIDPAIGSTVVLTTVTDVVGFFAFLGLAALLL